MICPKCKYDSEESEKKIREQHEPFATGWLLRQLEASSREVATWSKSKREAMEINNTKE